ncbi:hypothetical protein ACHAWF_015822 [Thalassiosira exigua]
MSVNIAQKWAKNANSPESEQLNTDDYVRVLFDSVFTLAPTGHNPECFRLYEAVEAGSIPILIKRDLYEAKPCHHSLMHWFNAPIVVLRDWKELYPTVKKCLTIQMNWTGGRENFGSGTSRLCVTR